MADTGKDLTGFIGLGNMGSRLARRIHDGGHKLCIYDANRAAVKRLAETISVTTADTPAEVARQCEVVILSLPNSDIVEQVALGEQGLVAGFRGGELVIDLSSISPFATRRIHEKLKASNVDFVDAPLTGGIVGAEEGTILTMLGGEEQPAERAKQYIRLYSDKIYYMGGPGSGDAMKTIKNMIANMAFAATNEGVTLGMKFGLDLKTMIEVFNNSTARNAATTWRFPIHIMTGRHAAGMKIGLVNKDLDICMDLAAKLNVPMLLARIGQQYWRFGVSRGLAEEDTTRVFGVVYELLTGEKFVPPAGDQDVRDPGWKP